MTIVSESRLDDVAVDEHVLVRVGSKLRLTWTDDDDKSLEAARQAFNKIVTEERVVAYSVKPGDAGTSGEVIKTFDPTAPKIVLSNPLVGG